MASFVPFTFIVLCGNTGSGKSRLLQQIVAFGYPAIDLEQIASHRGSAFGNVISSTQPSQKDFEKKLEQQIELLNTHNFLFIEQKPSSIGKRKIPGWLFNKINEGVFVELATGKEIRINNILKEYGSDSGKAFMNGLQKLKNRLPVTVINECEKYLADKNYTLFINTMLDYYDNAKQYQLNKKPIITLNGNAEVKKIADELIQELQEHGIIIS